MNEWVEGTMVNLWYDSNADGWEISTKTAIGGRYTYHRNHQLEDVADPMCPSTHPLEHVGSKTFREMFLEAITGISWMHEIYLSDTIEALGLSKYYSYSFVLQHPENHLVLPVDAPRLYLVAVYYVPHTSLAFRSELVTTTNTTIVQRIDHDVYQKWPELMSIPHIIRFPRVIPAATYSSLFRSYSCIHADLGEVGMGVCLTDRTTGMRTKVTSAVYLECKDFRGNHPNLLFQYLCLKHTKKLADFLVHFPGYASTFDHFQRQYTAFLVNIHASYVAHYVRRSGDVISPRFLPYIHFLHHDVYLPFNTVVTLNVVQEYMERFSPEEMFWILDRHDSFLRSPPSASIEAYTSLLRSEASPPKSDCRRQVDLGSNV